jgi:hypothetical protein
MIDRDLLYVVFSRSRRWHGIVAGVRILAECDKGLNIFVFQDGNLMLGFPRLAAIDEVI